MQPLCPRANLPAVFCFDVLSRRHLPGLTFGKSLLQFPLRLVGYSPGQHVDEVSQLISAETAPKLRRLTLEQGMAFAKGVLQRRRTVSDKATILSSNGAAKSLLVQDFQKEGVPVKSDDAADDPGVETSGERRRATSSMKAKTAKGKKRAIAIGKLTRKKLATKALYKAGGPQQLYGFARSGVAPIARAQLKATAVRATASCKGSLVRLRPWLGTSVKKTTLTLSSWNN